MKERQYIAAGLNMLDVIEIEGKVLPPALGGIPMYGYCGMRLWSDSVEYVARVGKDFFGIFDPWFTDNGIDPRSLRTVSDKTPYCVMKYDSDMNGIGGYFFTHNWADSDLWRPQPGDFDSCIGPQTKGFYICSAPQMSPTWQDIFSLREKFGFKIMWEPNGSHTYAADRDAIIELCRTVEMASFNVPEGERIFGIGSEDELIGFLKELGPELVLLRCGARGLYTIHDGEVWFIPSVAVPEGSAVVDTTGCGNTSTAGACVAWCEGKGPVMTGIMANISSSYNLRQKGPYPHIGETEMREAADLAQRLFSEKKFSRYGGR